MNNSTSVLICLICALCIQCSKKSTELNRKLNPFPEEKAEKKAEEVKSKSPQSNEQVYEIELIDEETKGPINNADVIINYTVKEQNYTHVFTETNGRGVYTLKANIIDVYNFKLVINKEGYRQRRIPIQDHEQIPKKIGLEMMR